VLGRTGGPGPSERCAPLSVSDRRDTANAQPLLILAPVPPRTVETWTTYGAGSLVDPVVATAIGSPDRRALLLAVFALPIAARDRRVLPAAFAPKVEVRAPIPRLEQWRHRRSPAGAAAQARCPALPPAGMGGMTATGTAPFRTLATRSPHRRCFPEFALRVR
jgi:hypothetical protein